MSTVKAGTIPDVVSRPIRSDLDPSKLTITLTKTPKSPPPPEQLGFGAVMSDHMLMCEYNPESGWSAPSIQPYAPISLDPASAIFHYTPSVFEGMKAFVGPDGKPRLFRPDLNMARMERSTDRVSLPHFDKDALLVLIKKLVSVDAHWIPPMRGYSMYIRPTLIGTRASLSVASSTSALLYVILSPSGPYFPTGFKPISLISMWDTARTWPGGTGAYKLGINYTPCFKPQEEAYSKGYQQILWLLGDERRITEAGQMNFFAVVQRDDGDIDLLTPPLDGTILPGVTRSSVLSLASSHSSSNPLSGIPASQRIHAQERIITISELQSHHSQGKLLEVFGVGTAAIICPVDRIGYEGEDMVMPVDEGLGKVGKAMWDEIVAIQEGLKESDWSVTCE